MPDLPTPDHQRAIELEVEVAGTPEEVWQAIATGPGIGSWYVPHTVEEREGGAATASFGPGPEMQVNGRVAAWDPPHRVVFDGGEGGAAWPSNGSSRPATAAAAWSAWSTAASVDGGQWDDQYDEMTEGWKLFLFNLQLHLAHFRGQAATAALPTSMWPGPPDEAWTTLTYGACAARPTGRRRPRRRRRHPRRRRSRARWWMPDRTGWRSWSIGPPAERRSSPSKVTAKPSASRCGPGSTAPTARRRPSGTNRLAGLARPARCPARPVTG